MNRLTRRLFGAWLACAATLAAAWWWRTGPAPTA
jgi:hypothetical protein